MTKNQKAAVIATETISFLARKHGITENKVMTLIIAGDAKLCRHLAQCIATAIIETA